MKYNSKYFFNKFYLIPGKKWTVGTFRRKTKEGEKCCALGHCNYDKNDLTEGESLMLLFNIVNRPVPGTNDYGIDSNYKVKRNTAQQAREAILCTLIEIMIKERGQDKNG